MSGHSLAAWALDRGRLCVAVDGSVGESLRISDISNNVVRVPEGRVGIVLSGGNVGAARFAELVQ